MDYKKIECLLEKYWCCQTTLKEEEELRRFFLETKELPLHLKEYREVFVFQAAERKVHLGKEFNEKILRQIQKKEKGRCYFPGYLLRVAAVVILLLAARDLLFYRNSSSSQTALTPEEASLKVREALDFVSLKLNLGEEMMKKNIEEMRSMTQYIKE